MFSWKKLGRMFNPADLTGHPWIKEFAQAPSALVLGDVVRIYFASRPAPDEGGNYVSLSAFAEFRRSNLLELVRVSQRPLLDLGPTGAFDEFGAYFTSVVQREADVLAYYVGYTRCESVPFTINIGAAVSHDGGESFGRLGPGPVLPCTLDEPFFLTTPRVKRIGGTWYLYYSAGRRWLRTGKRPEPVYHIRMATSTDAVHWTKQERSLIPTVIGPDECQACPDVFEYKGTFHMVFSYRSSTNYHGREGGYRMGYASSSDLLSWTRDDARAGLDVSRDGWDSEMVSFPHVFELDGQVYLLYLGNQMGRYGFGIAQLLPCAG